MNYCKIATDKRTLLMPNPYRTVIANPTEEKKALIAQLDGWLPMEYTEPPAYDPDTQYLTDFWEEAGGKAVQGWEVHDCPSEEEENDE